VTFTANYLTTTLPSQMRVNDLNHEVQVEDQVGNLAALLHKYSIAAVLGAQASQPITLGSAGAPPFAAPDGGTIGPGAVGSSAMVHAVLVGPLVLPSGGTPNTGSSGGCSLTPPVDPNQISCHGKTTVIWNFTGNNVTYTVSGTGGFSSFVNFTTSNSLITVGSVGGASDLVAVFGDHDTVFVNGTGGASVTFLLFGNNDTVSLNGKGGASFMILALGNYDSFSTSTNGASSSVLANIFGAHDSFSDSNTATVYYTGFNLQNPNATLCPYGNLAASTDTVSGSGGNVYYNDTNSTNANTTVGGWTYHYINPTPFACPYVLAMTISQPSAVTGFVVSLHNTYASAAEVAVDEGAVVYAQPGGIPLLLQPPAITLSHGSATIWFPVFTRSITTESGIGNVGILLRLLADQTLTLPSGAFRVSQGTPVTVTITTPYAAGWMAYFASNPTFSRLVSCTGPTSACSGAYQPGGPLGHVVISLPATSLTIQVATFSVQFT
jgi:hypothetical protein